MRGGGDDVMLSILHVGREACFEFLGLAVGFASKLL